MVKMQEIQEPILRRVRGIIGKRIARIRAEISRSSEIQTGS
ncbi:hypothetical protein [Helicobacter sp.]|nr:hypothetical protein [Helicobacter sp.]